MTVDASCVILSFMIIEIEGLKLEVSDKSLYDEKIEVGELYVGKRNTGWQLGTFRMMSPEGWVYDQARPGIYPYNDYECRKVLKEL